MEQFISIMDLSPRRLARLFGRAICLRCPNCGGGHIFRSWFNLKPRCPTCNLLLERNEQGYQVGSYMFNIIAAELLFGAALVGVLWLTWPAPPWDLLQYGGAALMILAPFLFFPFSKTLFLAFDLVFRPPTSEELS
jgi:uncharacterized protein (DUF983 family)